MPNTPHFVMAFYGILKAGAVVVAINPLYTPAEIAHQLNASSVSLVFVDSESYAVVTAARSASSEQRLIVAGPRKGVVLALSDLWLQEMVDKQKSLRKSRELTYASY